MGSLNGEGPRSDRKRWILFNDWTDSPRRKGGLMPRGLRGEKRAIMSVWDDFIHRLEQDLAECRRDLELLESGQMQYRERKGDDPWVDTTQRDTRKRLACTGVSYANFARNTENSQRASELAFGPQQSGAGCYIVIVSNRTLSCGRLEHVPRQ